MTNAATAVPSGVPERIPPKVWTKEEIVAKLDSSVPAVLRALLVIHSLQTADEQESATTKHRNKVGWSSWDAEIMTSLHDQYRQRGRLTGKQIELARKKLRFYWRQLMEVANGKLQVHVPPVDKAKWASQPSRTEYRPRAPRWWKPDPQLKVL